MSGASVINPTAGRRQLWQDMRAYLEYEREEGRDVVSLSQSAADRLNAWVKGGKGAPSAAASPAPAPAPARAPAPAPAPPPPAPPAPAPMSARSVQDDDASITRLAAIAREIAGCTRCSLAKTRNQTVPGHGNPRPDLVFIGEAPGEQEDRQGLPFVGRSGVLLTRMITNLGMSRDEVFIANIIKCRPPGNRTPTARERETCLPYLETQIDILRPKVLVALGATALHGLLGNDQALADNRGVWQEYRGIPLMTTYHPSYLLRNPRARHTTWDDMLKVLDRLGRRPPESVKGQPS